MLGLLAAAWLLWATSPYGIGIRTDSIAYIWSARNIADGVGIGRLDGYGAFRPMTHWPPLYPLILALFELAGIGAVEGARWLGAALLGANIFLSGLVLHRLTRSTVAAAAGALLVMVSPVINVTSLFAMTEPLYLAFTLLGLLLLDRYLEQPGMGRLVWLGIVAGLILVTRYVGLALALTTAAAILLFDRRSLNRRVGSLVVFGALSVLPLAAWLIRNSLVAGTATNRNLIFHPLQSGELYRAYTMVYAWFSPVKAIWQTEPLRAAIFLAVLASGIILIVRQRASGGFPPVENPSRAGRLPWILSIHAVTYAALILVSRLYFDEAIPLYEVRISAPFWLSILLLVIFLANRAWHWTSGRGTGASAVLLLGFGLFYSSFAHIFTEQSAEMFASQREQGSGVSQEFMANSGVVQAVGEIPDTWILYTNDLESLYFLTGRASWQIIELDESTTERIRTDLRQRGAAVVLMDTTMDKVQAVQAAFPEFSTAYTDNRSWVLHP